MKKNIIFFVMGFVLAVGISVYALSINARDTAYDNTNSGSNATNMQDAIDDLYTKAGSGDIKEIATIMSYYQDGRAFYIAFLNSDGRINHQTFTNYENASSADTLINAANSVFEYLDFSYTIVSNRPEYTIKAKKAGTFVVNYGGQKIEQHCEIGDTIQSFCDSRGTVPAVNHTPLTIHVK